VNQVSCPLRAANRHDECPVTGCPTPPPLAHSAAAERMCVHRERRRSGLRCFTLQIRAREIDVLVQRGLLSPDARNEPYAVKMALYRHLDETLRA
jgi:hypothetical protein